MPMHVTFKFLCTFCKIDEFHNFATIEFCISSAVIFVFSCSNILESTRSRIQVNITIH